MQYKPLLTNIRLFLHNGDMLVTKQSFQFKGFKPNGRVKQQTQFVYDFIESRAPSDSRKTASLTKKGDLYEARLKISSASSCSFEIYSKEQRPSDSMKSLKKKFLDKIVNWNKTRSSAHFF